MFLLQRLGTLANCCKSTTCGHASCSQPPLCLAASGELCPSQCMASALNHVCMRRMRVACRAQECSAAYRQAEAPEATWADAAVSEGVSAALLCRCYSVHLLQPSWCLAGRVAWPRSRPAAQAAPCSVKNRSSLATVRARGGWCSGTRATSRARSAFCASSWRWWTLFSRSATPGARLAARDAPCERLHMQMFSWILTSAVSGARVAGGLLL